MAPSLRSAASAPSTPAKTASSASVSTTPLRKSPRCKTCGRPRKGHPQRACESSDVDVDVASPSVASIVTPRKPKAETPAKMTPARPSAAAALQALSLSPEHEQRDEADKRARRKSLFNAQYTPADLQSLPSISTITDELLDGLTMMSIGKDNGDGHGARGQREEDVESDEEVEQLLADDEVDLEEEGDSSKRAAILQWRDASGTPRKVRLHTPAVADETTPTKVLGQSNSKSKARIGV
ncbi:hypothetical protein HMN09_01143800 [Mycena chlorophos]|uniref:Uncharacterized protein n=1 Tax=Mycena chlorophos TaxID=658473 RepID=A0A8H6S773_MYCCL|nr:hypothetical protein HMN09_01143800 [Mycena chlorophos]